MSALWHAQDPAQPQLALPDALAVILYYTIAYEPYIAISIV